MTWNCPYSSKSLFSSTLTTLPASFQPGQLHEKVNQEAQIVSSRLLSPSAHRHRYGIAQVPSPGSQVDKNRVTGVTFFTGVTWNCTGYLSAIFQLSLWNLRNQIFVYTRYLRVYGMLLLRLTKFSVKQILSNNWQENALSCGNYLTTKLHSNCKWLDDLW